jgi:hypothetical protein
VFFEVWLEEVGGLEENAGRARRLYGGRAGRAVCQYMSYRESVSIYEMWSSQGVAFCWRIFSAGISYFLLSTFPPGAGGSWRFMHHAAQGGNEVEGRLTRHCLVAV